MREAGLRLKSSKSVFMMDQIEYLGHKINSEGWHPLENKVQALHNAPKPTNNTVLKAYLGLLNYYHRFLPNVSTVLAPLHVLLRKRMV